MKRAYRNTQDKVIAGVCTGLGEYFSIDPLFIRIIFLLLFFEPPFAVIGYVALWIALPKKPLDLPKVTFEEFQNASNETARQANTSFEQRAEEFANEAEQIGNDLAHKVESIAKEFEESFESKKTDRKINIEINVEKSGKKSKAFAIILISLGALFLAHNFIPDMNFEKYWPLILIGIGISILFSGKKEGQS